MTSEASEVFVWMHLPNQAEPVVCGRFAHRRVPGGSAVGEFVYGRSYLERRDAVPIDPVALPLRPNLFSTPHLSGWFSALLDAGPDDWGRRLVDQLEGPQDTMGYLLRARGQPVGALVFGAQADAAPAGAGPSPSVRTLERLLHLHRAIEAGDDVPEADRALLVHGTSAGGARPKTTIEHDGALWLAKFPSAKDRDDQPPVASMEAALLDAAAACDIRVPRHRVVKCGPSRVLLVERFDRHRLPDGRYARRRYASARTLLWSSPEVQAYSYMGSYSNLVHQMRRWERTPRESLRELYRRIAFNCLVGNTDDHDRNTGFIADDGFFRLAPAFDLTARPATPRMFLAMGFGKEGAAVTWVNLLSEPGHFGYEAAEAAAAVRRQWEIVSSMLVERLAAHGCGKRLAAASLQVMPGWRLIEEGRPGI